MKIVSSPTRIEAAGHPVKIIEEYIGLVNSGDKDVSIAVMTSPQGWEEPGQGPEFVEYTLVLEGNLQVTSKDGVHRVRAGEVLCTDPGEWVQYSTPLEGGARYVAICLPAFSPETVNRDDDKS